jgi:hypothetical protein
MFLDNPISNDPRLSGIASGSFVFTDVICGDITHLDKANTLCLASNSKPACNRSSGG